jgi:LEA14-like dessication related protein
MSISMVNNMNHIYINTLSYSLNKNFGSFLFLLLAYLCSGCTSIRPDFERPSVTIISFKPLTSEDLTPKFEIGMKVINGNATKLSLRGMSYKVFVNNYEVVAGAANDLPAVPAYGEVEFKVLASIGLIEGLRLARDLVQNSSSDMTYRIQTKLDVGAMYPAIRIDKTGSFAP